MGDKKQKRGVSFGTLLMLGITLVVVFACTVILPKIAGEGNEGVDALKLVNTITTSLDLPELTMSDIPIFSAGSTTNRETPTKAPESGQGASLPASTPAPSAEPTATPPPATATFTITAGGTVAFRKAIRQAGYYSESEVYDFSDLFTYISDSMAADLSMVTLENTISTENKISDVNTVPEVLAALSRAGVDMVALGNPNIMDYKLAGFTDTVSRAQRAGFTTPGVSLDGTKGAGALFVEIKGVKIAVLHYLDALSDKGKKNVKNEDAGYAVALYDETTIAADIQATRGQGARLVIVMMHWGTLDQKSVTKKQTATAQQIADAGADILLGAGTETVLPITYLTATGPDGGARTMLAAYSLGALLTDARADRRCGGVLLHMEITCNLSTGAIAMDRVTYTPTYMWRFKDSAYQYRIVPSHKSPPVAMDDSQRKVMDKILGVVQKALEDSPVTLAQ